MCTGSGSLHALQVYADQPCHLQRPSKDRLLEQLVPCHLSIMGAAERVLNVERDQLNRSYGRYWITSHRSSAYQKVRY